MLTEEFEKRLACAVDVCAEIKAKFPGAGVILKLDAYLIARARCVIYTSAVAMAGEGRPASGIIAQAADAIMVRQKTTHEPGAGEMERALCRIETQAMIGAWTEIIKLCKDDIKSGSVKPAPAVGPPCLLNHADGVDGHYSIARKWPDGTTEFWRCNPGRWASAGDVFALAERTPPLGTRDEAGPFPGTLAGAWNERFETHPQDEAIPFLGTTAASPGPETEKAIREPVVVTRNPIPILERVNAEYLARKAVSDQSANITSYVDAKDDYIPVDDPVIFSKGDICELPTGEHVKITEVRDRGVFVTRGANGTIPGCVGRTGDEIPRLRVIADGPS